MYLNLMNACATVCPAITSGIAVSDSTSQESCLAVLKELLEVPSRTEQLKPGELPVRLQSDQVVLCTLACHLQYGPNTDSGSAGAGRVVEHEQSTAVEHGSSAEDPGRTCTLQCSTKASYMYSAQHHQQQT